MLLKQIQPLQITGVEVFGNQITAVIPWHLLFIFWRQTNNRQRLRCRGRRAHLDGLVVFPLKLVGSRAFSYLQCHRGKP